MKISLWLSVLLMLLGVSVTHAGSATWNLNPSSNRWNTATNWTPATVPDGPSDVATFSVSNQTNLLILESVDLDQMVFEPGASSYTMTCNPRVDFDLMGAGIVNNSGVNQIFVTRALQNQTGIGNIEFFNNASAGNLNNTFINRGAVSETSSGITQFFDNSTAGSATFINEGGSLSGTWGGRIYFYDSSSAGTANFMNHGATMGPIGGQIFFNDEATADHGTFVCNGGEAPGGRGEIWFRDNSTAANADFTINGGAATDAHGGIIFLQDDMSLGSATFTINGGTASGAEGGSVNGFCSGAEDPSFTVNGGQVAGAGRGSLHISGRRPIDLRDDVLAATGGIDGAEGGLIHVGDKVDGGHAQFKLFGNSVLDISAHDRRRFVTGSIEGEGTIDLGAKTLSVGRNHRDTVFSGIIQDASSDGDLGSIRKIGTSTLTLAGANTYAGGTIVNRGKLLVNNASGSGVGIGIVEVNNGTLGGKGTIAGTVTVGMGDGSEAILAPGANGANIGTLTLQSQLTFNSNATYQFGVNSNARSSDQVLASGVTINGAQLLIADLGNSTLPAGTVFTVISNASANPISGAFANLPDGSIFTVGSNTFQANYEGGDGNDLTLTVIH